MQATKEIYVAEPVVVVFDIFDFTVFGITQSFDSVEFTTLSLDYWDYLSLFIIIFLLYQFP